MSISGLKAFSIYNPADGVVAQFNNIAPEGQFYSRPMEGGDTTPSGEAVYGADESFAELVTYDFGAGLDQAETWMKANKRVSMVAAGFQQNIQWYETDFVQVERRFYTSAGRRNAAVIRMRREGQGTHTIYGNVNLLHGPVPWKDSNVDEKVDGYTFLPAIMVSTFLEATSEQRVEGSAGSLEVYYPLLVFPIAGVGVTFSFEWTKLHASSAVSSSMGINDFAGGSLVLNSQPVATLGRKSMTSITPAGSFKASLVAMRVANITAFDNAYGRWPSLRVDGSDQYAAY